MTIWGRLRAVLHYYRSLKREPLSKLEYEQRRKAKTAQLKRELGR